MFFSKMDGEDKFYLSLAILFILGALGVSAFGSISNSYCYSACSKSNLTDKAHIQCICLCNNKPINCSFEAEKE